MQMIERFAFIACSLLTADSLVACSSTASNSADWGRGGEFGMVRVAVTAKSHGHEYRVRHALYTIDGPAHLVLDSEANLEQDVLTADLIPGHYTSQLTGTWFLERLDPAGPVPVKASLVSPNPAAFDVQAGAVTAVPFSFDTNGELLTTAGTGSVAISAEVNEHGLSLLAGKLGGLGSGDGIGPDGRFFEPTGITNDGTGNLYVADGANATIRRIALGTMEVTTIAGSAGVRGFEDGIGANARFYQPRGICLDQAGRLYVTDRINYTIRRVVPSTGEVTTFAGTAGAYGSSDGVGAAASFRDPTAITSDDGHLYVTDENIIRQIDIATGEVTTIAGLESDPFGSDDGIGSAARFDMAMGIAADHLGNLFVADTANQIIRKLVLATREVTTVAGRPKYSGTTDGTVADARFSEPRGIATDGEGHVFVADSHSNAIRKIDLVSGTVTTIAGGTSGGPSGNGTDTQLAYPEGLVTDGAGNLWVADSENDVIRRIDLSTGQMTTAAGALFPPLALTDGIGAAAGVSGVSAMASDSSGRVYFANGTVIRDLDVATGTVTTISGAVNDSRVVDGIGAAARFGGVSGIVLDNGILYLCDSNTVRQLNLTTGEVVTLAGTPDISGHADGFGPAASFDAPESIASDGAGHLYIADFFNALIRRVDITTREVTTVAGVLSAYTSVDGVGRNASFWSMRGLVFDGSSSLYLMDGPMLRKLALDSTEVTTIAGSSDGSASVDGVGPAAGFTLADGLAVGDTGTLFVADTQGHTIRRVDLSTATVTTVVGNPKAAGVHLGALPARLTLPRAVTVLPDRSLVISDEAALLAARF